MSLSIKGRREASGVKTSYHLFFQERVFEIGVKKFYDKENGYQTRFGVSKRVMRSYLMSLEAIFSVVIKEGKYYITPKRMSIRK